MPPPLQPEFFALLGIDLFLAQSLLTCLLDKHFPWQLPYLFQLASLVGFGNLLISREFLMLFDEYMRFWYSLAYLVIALASIVAVNVYLGYAKKLLNHAKAILFTVTFPMLSIAAFFVANYAQVAIHPLVMVPQLSWETTFIGIVALDTLVVGLGTYVFFKPKWWYIGLGSTAAVAGSIAYTVIMPAWGQSAFIVLAVALAVSCILVLSVSVYILGRMWVDTWKNRRRKKEVK